ncbi:MAG: flavin reductase family protein [Nanoarchaeota archaeon]|nr:flavin reductase family protein [Nanoarchaeota archaeon]
MSELTGPRQVILVTCRGSLKKEMSTEIQEKDGIIAVAWHMPVSKEPFLYAIAIGKTRFTHQLIEQSQSFAVNFMSADQKEAIIKCGTISSKHIDKFKEANLTKEECESIDCPRIKEVIGYLECQVKQKIPAGDHTVFIGHVHNHKLNKDKPRLYHITKDKFAQTR